LPCKFRVDLRFLCSKPHPMKKVFCLVGISSVIVFSCKTAQINSMRPFTNEVKVIDLGYMPGYKPNAVKKDLKKEKDNINSVDRDFSLGNKTADPASGVLIQNTSFRYPQNATKEIGVDSLEDAEILLYAAALKKYAVENGYDTTYAFLANMGQLTTTKRLYIIDLSSMKILNKGLVSHGRGKGSSIYVKQYSNAPGSNCTSLGKYKIMSSYTGNYGYSYRMAGLEETNNNALKRNTVLHAMSCIPDRENYAPACVTEGCPAVSKQFLSSVEPVLQSRKAPVLFWIFDSLLQQAIVDTKHQNVNTGN
jgi:L,D-transpeptidase catalytic domain